MNGTTIVGQADAGGNPGPSWHVKGAGDFNGDGKADILWQNDNGQAAIWLMNGTTPFEPVRGRRQSGPDLARESCRRLQWRRQGRHPVAERQRPGRDLADERYDLARPVQRVGANPGPSWHVTDAGDFNGDGKADIAWQNDNGQAAIWLMNGLNPIAQTTVGSNPGVRLAHNLERGGARAPLAPLPICRTSSRNRSCSGIERRLAVLVSRLGRSLGHLCHSVDVAADGSRVHLTAMCERPSVTIRRDKVRASLAT